jgi:hypothetical protein
MSADIERLAQIGAGRDGVAYRARHQGAEVEYRALAAAWADPLRCIAISRRLRLARLLDHAGARRLRQLDLEVDPPFVVLDPPAGPTLGEQLAGKRPLPALEAIALTLDLAGLLHAAHRLGLGHGRLSPQTIHAGIVCLVQLDFTDLAVRPDESPLALNEADACAADVVAVAALLGWLMSEEDFDPARSPPAVVTGRVRALISDVLGAEVGDRPAIGEIEDRLRQLLRLLQQQAGLDLTRPAVEEPPARADTPRRERLGRFRLREKLGQGGMGEVWRAEDSSDGGIVAIKTLLPEYARRPESARRFRKEARLLAEVNNPYVTNLLEVNEDDGIHYLAVEYVPGRSVADKLDEGKPLEESFALAVIADVCRALVDAHARGIIHRDIKPDNILLLLDPTAADLAATLGSGEIRPLAKLSDFGLARHIVESDSLQVTRTGPWSARRCTCRRSSAAARGWTRAPMSTAWARRCSTCWPAGRRTSATAR